MFDLSWSELLLVGAIALVVIGPRELPRVLRTVGQSLAKLRRMAGDFQSQFNAAMREAELDDIRNSVRGAQDTAGKALQGGGVFNPLKTVRDELRDAITAPSSAAPPSFATAFTPLSDEAASVVMPASSNALAPAAGSVDGSAVAILSAQPADERKVETKAKAKAKAKTKRAARGRIIVASPRDAVKRLERKPAGTRLYKKMKFSSMPARTKPASHNRHDDTPQNDGGAS